jgi:hypothetical protein
LTDPTRLFAGSLELTEPDRIRALPAVVAKNSRGQPARTASVRDVADSLRSRQRGLTVEIAASGAARPVNQQAVAAVDPSMLLILSASLWVGWRISDER